MLLRRGLAASAIVLALPTAAAAAGSAYVTNYSGSSVSQYDMGAGGALSPKSPATVSAPGTVEHPAISMDGASLYAPEDGPSPNLAQFDIGAGGLLSAKTVPEAPGAPATYAAAVSPDGQSAYVANQDGTVSQYDVGAGGLLTPKSPASVALAGAQFNALAVSPRGNALWVPDSDNARVAQFDIAADGTLSLKTPATVPAGTTPEGIVVTPDSHNLYVTNFGGASVAQYDVDASGALTPKTPTTVVSGTAPAQPAVSPDGTSLYAPFSGGVSQYDVGVGGALVPKSPAAVPAPGAFNAGAVAPGGRSVYAVDTAGATVAQFDVGPGGVLTAKAPATVAAGLGAFGIALTPDRGPSAAFSAAPGRATAASAFDASGSSDPDGTVARYDWAFGDGTTAPNAGPSPSHPYAAPGSYQVTLTVTDDLGCSGALVFTGQTASCAPSAGTVGHSIAVLPAAFGASTGVTLRLLRRRIATGKPLVVVVANRNPFAVRGRLSGRTAKAIAAKRKRRLSVRAKAFQVGPNAKTKVRLKLPAALGRALTRQKKLTFRLSAAVRDPAGGRRRVAKTVTAHRKR